MIGCAGFSNYLVLIFPLTSIVNAAVSLAPPLTLKTPETLRVPVAPAYLPVPPVICALPVTLIVVGADSSSAQPLADVSNETLSVFQPPPIAPFASNESQRPAGAAAAVPDMSVRPRTFPVPLPVTDGT